MATVTKRGDTYRIRCSVGYDANGKQIMRSKTWKPAPGMTEKQIQKELERQKVLFEDRCNGLIAGGNIKFQALAEQWLEHIEKNGLLRIRTIDRLKQLQERTYAAVGHLHMDKLTSVHIQKFIDNLAEPGVNKHTGGGLSVKTQKHYLNFISDVFEYAIKNNMLIDNPCRRVDIPPEQTPERDCYTLEEAQQFLEALETAPMKYRVFFTLAMFGGFRCAELLGLEWKDINFETGVITIARSSLYTAQRGMFTDTTKTQKSKRSLKMPDEVIQLLIKFKAEQAAERLSLGDKWVNMDRLFTAWNGSPMGHTSAINWLAKFCKQNSLRYVNVHSFRHLNASLLINNGVDVKTVSAALGHSQTTTTLNIYAHTFATAQAAASEAIANTLLTKADKKKA